MRIAVVGPGAIGGTVAAWLAQVPGHEVVLCARRDLDRLEIETPDGSIAAEPAVLTDPAAAEPVDWVLVAVKAYATDGAAAWLERLIGPATRVAILQNGVEHRERFAPFVPADRLLPAIVDIPAERTAPGRIRQRRTGWIRVPEGEAGKDFVRLFDHSPIDVATTEDWTSVAWRKLCLNSGGAVSALTLAPGGVVRREDVAELVRGIVRECIAVGRAEGADLPDSIADDVVANDRAAPADAINSMLADRLAGRPLELDARNGVIVRLGERHGIPTPLNRLMATLISAAAEEGVRS